MRLYTKKYLDQKESFIQDAPNCFRLVLLAPESGVKFFFFLTDLACVIPELGRWEQEDHEFK